MTEQLKKSVELEQKLKEKEKELRELKELIEKARKEEAKPALEEVKRLIKEYGFTAKDLQASLAPERKPSSSKAEQNEAAYSWPAIGKYREQKWAGGKGRVPAFIQEYEKNAGEGSKKHWHKDASTETREQAIANAKAWFEE